MCPDHSPAAPLLPHFSSLNTKNYKTVNQSCSCFQPFKDSDVLQTLTLPAIPSDLTPGFLSDLTSHLCPLWHSCASCQTHRAHLRTSAAAPPWSTLLLNSSRSAPLPSLGAHHKCQVLTEILPAHPPHRDSCTNLSVSLPCLIFLRSAYHYLQL